MAQGAQQGPEAGRGKPAAPSRLQVATRQPARVFVAVLVALVVLILAAENWPLVRFSLLGVAFDVPGTIVYLIFLIIGMVIYWVLNIRYTAGQTGVSRRDAGSQSSK